MYSFSSCYYFFNILPPHNIYILSHIKCKYKTKNANLSDNVLNTTFDSKIKRNPYKIKLWNESNSQNNKIHLIKY